MVYLFPRLDRTRKLVGVAVPRNIGNNKTWPTFVRPTGLSCLLQSFAQWSFTFPSKASSNPHLLRSLPWQEGRKRWLSPCIESARWSMVCSAPGRQPAREEELYRSQADVREERPLDGPLTIDAFTPSPILAASKTHSGICAYHKTHRTEGKSMWNNICKCSVIYVYEFTQIIPLLLDTEKNTNTFVYSFIDFLR